MACGCEPNQHAVNHAEPTVSHRVVCEVGTWVGGNAFCSPDAAVECERYAAEYKAKAETAVAPSDRRSFAGIAERFVAMARGCEVLDPFAPEWGDQRPALAWRLN
jgi:hypothetical protein